MLAHLKIANTANLEQIILCFHQEEHWIKVHHQHCKFLSGKRVADGTRHDPASCRFCLEELGGKIVLHLLIGIQLGKKDNILGSIPNQLGSIWFYPNSIPSQTLTNHPYGFFWNINNSVPKRNWNFGSLKINYVYLSINRRNSLSESTVWNYF